MKNLGRLCACQSNEKPAKLMHLLHLLLILSSILLVDVVDDVDSQDVVVSIKLQLHFNFLHFLQA